MSCQIEEALSKLDELLATDMSKETRSKLEGLRKEISSKADKGVNSESVKTEERVSAKYTRVMNKLVRDLLGTKVTTSQYLAFSDSLLDKLSVIGGRYANRKVTISTTPKQDAFDAQARGMFEEWYIRESPYAVKYQSLDPEKVATLLSKDEEFQKAFNLQEPSIKAAMKEALQELKGAHTFAHEMVHAGSIEFMKEYPNHEYTKRMNELYEEAVAQKDSILFKMGKDRSDYWTTNVEEFIAEGLSNPALIKALNYTKTDPKKRFTNMFKDILKLLLDMLGVKKEDNIYNYLLDGYMAMLESQAPSHKSMAKVMDDVTARYYENKAKTNTKLDTIQNILGDDIDPRDIDTILC